jgi:hypothetical protein
MNTRFLKLPAETKIAGIRMHSPFVRWDDVIMFDHDPDHGHGPGVATIIGLRSGIIVKVDDDDGAIYNQLVAYAEAPKFELKSAPVKTIQGSGSGLTDYEFETRPVPERPID